MLQKSPSGVARTLMVQGTASSVGKSLLVTALCRLFRREGLRVAPFKAQNMALNAAVTVDGLEIGRAQAVQAEAAGVPLTVDMNPVLIKPEGDMKSQLVLMGRASGRMLAGDFARRKPELAQVIAASLARLRAQHDVVVIEGAGSPAEVNLKAGEIVNMHVARLAGAPVLLAADIDRGGVFASVVGTLELLDPEERAHIAGVVINKFRGDLELLRPGLTWLEERTRLPVLGVVPYLRDLGIADEDSVSLEERRRRRRPPTGWLDVAVICLPRLSNQDDFDPLEREPEVAVRFVDRPEEIAGADLVVLPGSKATMADLAWLRDRGFEPALRARAAREEPILGICGGCQMLGRAISDPHGVEGGGAVDGLGLLPLQTRFATEKTTAVVTARATAAWPFGAVVSDLRGYEIHMGQLEPAHTDLRAPFVLTRRQAQRCERPDGAVEGSVTGTMVHGLLANDSLRRALLATLRARRGLPTPVSPPFDPEAAYDRLADAVRASVDWPRVLRITGF